MIRLAALATALLVWAGASQPDRQAIHVSVTDANGDRIEGLGPADFAVSLNGQVVPVLGAAVNQDPLGIVVIADLSTSHRYIDLRPGPQPSQTNSVTETVRGVIDGVLREARAGDEIRLALVGGARVRLTELLRHTVGPFMELIRQSADCTGYGSPLWDAVAIAADSLKATPGRRLIVMVTDGRVNGSWLSLDDAARYALVHGAAVSAIDEGPPVRVRQDDGQIASFQAERTLRWLTEQTGGRYLPDNRAIGRKGTSQSYPLARRAVESARNSYVVQIPRQASGSRAALKVTVRRAGSIVDAPAFADAGPARTAVPLPPQVQPEPPGTCR